MDHRLEVRVVDWAQQQNLRLTAAVTMAEQSCAKHACGVDDERVSWRNQIGQIAEGAVVERACCAIEDEQPTGIAGLDGLLRDAVVGERVVVVGRTAARGLDGHVCGGVRIGVHGVAKDNR